MYNVSIREETATFTRRERIRNVSADTVQKIRDNVKQSAPRGSSNIIKVTKR